MATRLDLENSLVAQTLKKTICPGATDEEIVAFVIVANEHKLNPFKREIYCFKKQGGGLAPMVPIDGWTNIVNSHPQFDGCEFEDNEDSDGKLEAITCTIHRKDRQHPTVLKERMKECFRDTGPWRDMPARMLRHKAFMQCARVAFSLGGIFDEDEANDQVIRAKAEHLEPPRQIPADVIDTKTGEVAPGKTTFGKGKPYEKTVYATDETRSADNLISESQRRRLFAISHKSGIKDDDLKAHLHHCHGLDSSKLITTDVYEEICEWAAEPPTQQTAG